MAGELLGNTLGRERSRAAWGWAFVALVVAVGEAGRAWVLFHGPLVPGINGGYYLVQARSLLEKGALAFPDLPLTFGIHACIAALFHTLTGVSLDACVPFAVKVCEALLPPLAAIPVFLLGRRLNARFGRPDSWLPLAAAAMASFGGATLGLAGDFEKNALGLVWLAGLMDALHGSMQHRTRSRACMALAFLGLLAVTHIGVFAVGFALAAAVFVAYVALPGDRPWGEAWPWAVAALAILGVIGAVIAWKFDPERVERILNVFTQPASAALGRGHSAGAPRAMGPPVAGAPGPPGMPMPGGLWLASLAPFAIFGGIAIWALAIAWKRRTILVRADAALVAGVAGAMVFVAGPWFQGDITMRLLLIAILPMSILVLFILLNIRRALVRRILGGAALAIAIAPSIFIVIRGEGLRGISNEAYGELLGLRDDIPDPEGTLIVAGHGIEWWTAWALHTHVAQPSGLRAEDWSTFDRVLFLESKDRFMPGGPPHGFKLPYGVNPPAGGFPGGMAPGMPPGGPGHGSPPMGSPSIPSDAEVLHDGDHFKLALVRTPPNSNSNSGTDYEFHIRHAVQE